MATAKKCDRCGKFYDRNNRMGKGLLKMSLMMEL